MKNEWKVASNIIAGRKMYIVYRARNKAEVLHAGNVEYVGEYTTNKEEAEILAEKLNAESEKK